LLNVQVSWLSIESEPIPVKYPIGGITVLLNLENYISSTDGMQTAAWQEHKTAGLRWEPVQQTLHGPVCEGGLKIFPHGAVFEADVDARTFVSVDEVP
jgi:hypothetical protein